MLFKKHKLNMEIVMSKERMHNIPVVLGISLLFASSAVLGDSLQDVLEISPVKKLNDSMIYQDGDKTNIRSVLEHLATAVHIDEESGIDVILYDYQSQENIGRLVWSHDAKQGTIDLQYMDISDKVPMLISDYDNLSQEEKQNTLKQGLLEAGYAWLSNKILKQSEFAGIPSKRDYAAQDVSILRYNTVGVFDWVNPRHLENYFKPADNVTRQAAGWAYDPDRSSESIWVHFYGRHQEDESYRYLGALLANSARPDVNRAYGITGNHGWSVQIPESWDADGHDDESGSCVTGPPPVGVGGSVTCRSEFRAIAIDVTGGKSSYLRNTPYDISTYTAW
jgi:hypothetical protein